MLEDVLIWLDCLSDLCIIGDLTDDKKQRSEHQPLWDFTWTLPHSEFFTTDLPSLLFSKPCCVAKKKKKIRVSSRFNKITVNQSGTQYVVYWDEVTEYNSDKTEKNNDLTAIVFNGHFLRITMCTATTTWTVKFSQ